MGENSDDNDPFEEDIIFDQAGLLRSRSSYSRQQTNIGFIPTFMLFIRTVFLCVAFVGLGLCTSVSMGPLIHLEVAIGVSTTKAFHSFTAQSVGMLVGGLLGSVLFEKYNRQFLIFVSLVWMSISICVLPFAVPVSFWWTLFNLATLGAGLAFISTGSNVLCLDLWGKQGGASLQSLHFSFSLGAFVAPILIHPFISSTYPLTGSEVTHVTPLPSLSTLPETSPMRFSLPEFERIRRGVNDSWTPVNDLDVDVKDVVGPVITNLTVPTSLESLTLPDLDTSIDISDAEIPTGKLSTYNQSFAVNFNKETLQQVHNDTFGSSNTESLDPKPKPKPAFTNANLIPEKSKWKRPSQKESVKSVEKAKVAKVDATVKEVNVTIPSTIPITVHSLTTPITEAVYVMNDVTPTEPNEKSIDPTQLSTAGHLTEEANLRNNTSRTIGYSDTVYDSTANSKLIGSDIFNESVPYSEAKSMEAQQPMTESISAELHAPLSKSTPVHNPLFDTREPNPVDKSEMYNPSTKSTAVHKLLANSKELQIPLVESTEVHKPLADLKDVRSPSTKSTEVNNPLADLKDVRSPLAESTEVNNPLADLKDVETTLAEATAVHSPMSGTTVPEAPVMSEKRLNATDNTSGIHGGTKEESPDQFVRISKVNQEELKHVDESVLNEPEALDLMESPVDSTSVLPSTAEDMETQTHQSKPGTFSNVSDSNIRFFETLVERFRNYGVTSIHFVYICIGAFLLFNAFVSVIIMCHNPREPRSKQEDLSMAELHRNRMRIFIVLFSVFMFTAEALQGSLHHLLASSHTENGLPMTSKNIDGAAIFWGLVCIMRFLCILLSGCLKVKPDNYILGGFNNRSGNCNVISPKMRHK